MGALVFDDFVLKKRRAAKCKDSKSEASTKSDCSSSSSTISVVSRSNRGNCSSSSGDSIADLLTRPPKARTIIITLILLSLVIFT